MTTGTLDDHQPQGRWSTLRSRVGYVLIIVGVLTLVLIGVVIPMPYVIEGPGPTFNVLGKDGGKKIIQVSGAQTYPTKGQLRMVTVSLRGGPGSHVTGLEVLWALASKDSQVYREEEIYPKSLSADDVKKIAQAQMTGSQSSAEVAALTELGMTVPATFTVVSVGKDSPSAGKLKEGDVLTAITIDGTRHELKDGASLFSIMEKTPAKTPVTVDFNRSGVAHQVTVKSVKRPDGQGSIIGVGLDPKVKPPVKVTVSLQDWGPVGGNDVRPRHRRHDDEGVANPRTGDRGYGRHLDGWGSPDDLGRAPKDAWRIGCWRPLVPPAVRELRRRGRRRPAGDADRPGRHAPRGTRRRRGHRGASHVEPADLPREVGTAA